MKLDARQTAAFLRDPGPCRLVLLHGEDDGLIRERALVLTRQVARVTNDPFLVVELTREGWNRIPAEVSALSMIGGRRVVQVRDATDATLPFVVEAGKGPGEALLVLEAVGLGRGKLRNFVEAAKDAVSIACYAEEGRALEELISSLLAEHGISVERDALTWLGLNLGSGRSLVRGEVEKLALLAGPGGQVDLDMAAACLSDATASVGDNGVLAATDGQIAQQDRVVDQALADGLNGVALMRSALLHLQKMHLAKLQIQQGMSSAEAIRAMRPPVFFKAAATMSSAMMCWTDEQLLRAIEEAGRIELACKQTGSRPELLARRFVQDLARKARQNKPTSRR